MLPPIMISSPIYRHTHARTTHESHYVPASSASFHREEAAKETRADAKRGEGVQLPASHRSPQNKLRSTRKNPGGKKGPATETREMKCIGWSQSQTNKGNLSFCRNMYSENETVEFTRAYIRTYEAPQNLLDQRFSPSSRLKCLCAAGRDKAEGHPITKRSEM